MHEVDGSADILMNWLTTEQQIVKLAHLVSSLELRTTRSFTQGRVVSLLWKIVLDGVLTRLGES